MKLSKFLAYLVHLFTAFGAVFGILALYEIYLTNFKLAFIYMGITILIDSVDGTLARAVQIKKTLPTIDGALLDNIIDYLTYVICPGFLLLTTDLLLPSWKIVAVCAVVLTSAYQFTQSDAKTEDHFFKGFPDYWNLVVFYFFFWNLSQTTNTIIIIALAILVFVPIKYIYPSRTDFLTSKKWLRQVFLASTVIWGVVTVLLMITFPVANPILMGYTLFYIAFYVLFSLYRTFVPIRISSLRSAN